MLDYFSTRLARGIDPVIPRAVGYIARVVGLTLEARGINLPLGARAIVADHSAVNSEGFEVEVVGFDAQITYLMPLRPLAAVKPGARVTPIASSDCVPAGMALLGRVVDGTGKPLDALEEYLRALWLECCAWIRRTSCC